MARNFPLAGLLRLRHAQQDQAGAALATANDRMRDAADARVAARRTLSDGPVEISDATMLSAVAAARASTRGMLEELDAVARTRRQAADVAQSAYNDARRSALGLEKLEGAHAVRTAAEDLRGEQIVLDEIAATQHRGATGAAEAAGVAGSAATGVAAAPSAPGPMRGDEVLR